MKFVYLVFCLVSFSAYSQQDQQDLIAWQKSVNDLWFNSHVDSMLKTGDKVPEIPLGIVRNNPSDIKTISDLKGKLVILDFWNTGCYSCIQAFPEIEKLQKELDYEYPGKVQIILVDPTETSEVSTKFLARISHKGASIKNFSNGEVKIPNDLPSIEGVRTDIQKLFPTRYVGHHVWIDENGKVMVVGPNINTYKEKIRKYLAGQPISYINDNDNSPIFGTYSPAFYKLIGHTINPSGYSSYFTSFNNNVCPFGLGTVKNYADSNTNTIRNSYVNINLWELLRFHIFKKELVPQLKTIINNAKSGWGNLLFFDLFVSDTLQYLGSYINLEGKKLTDDMYSKGKFCYEQVIPASMSDKEIQKRTIHDVNNYFGRLYGTQVQLEKRKLKCFILKRTSSKDKFESKGKAGFSFKKVQNADQKTIEVVSYNLFSSINQIIYNTAVSKFFNEGDGSIKTYFFDETNYTNNNNDFVKLVVPQSINTVEELRAALKPYDLDISLEDRELNFVVLKEKGNDRL